MTDKHPMLPTRQQLADWESEYFDENQNFDVMMIKAFQSGADLQLEQVIEWLLCASLYDYLYLCDDFAEIKKDELIADLKKEMRPQQLEDNNG